MPFSSTLANKPVFYDLDHENKSDSVLALPDNFKRYQIWYQPLDYCEKKHLERQNEILSVIRELYVESNKEPSLNRIEQVAKCDYSTAKPALEAFKQELLAEQNKKALLIYVLRDKCRLIKLISKGLQQSLDTAAYVLDVLCPDTTYFLTCVCPGNSELAYLATAFNSKLIVDNLLINLKLLLPKDFELYSFGCWENQVERQAPHLHICLNLPIGTVLTPQLQQSLTDIWFYVLDEVGSFYNIDMFENADGTSYSRDNPDLQKHLVHIQPFTLQLNTKYAWTYLAKTATKDLRELEIADGKPIGFKSWGYVSPSLKSYVKALPLFEKIPAGQRDDVEQIIEQTQSLIDSQATVEWKEHFSCWKDENGYNKQHLGYKTRFHPKNFNRIKELLSDRAVALDNQSLGLGLSADTAANFVVFDLKPNGKCVLKRSYSRKNYQYQQEEYRQRKRRRS